MPLSRQYTAIFECPFRQFDPPPFSAGVYSILSFRKNDRFQFFGVEVNQFVEELMDRRLQDQKSLNDVQIALSQMRPNPTTEDLRKILKFLDS